MARVKQYYDGHPQAYNKPKKVQARHILVGFAGARNASPEAAAGGGLALVKTGDRLRIDLKKCTADMLVDDAELDARRAALPERPFAPDSRSPWQEIFREKVEPFSKGMVLRGAPDYQDIARTKGVPRDNH